MVIVIKSIGTLEASRVLKLHFYEVLILKFYKTCDYDAGDGERIDKKSINFYIQPLHEVDYEYKINSSVLKKFPTQVSLLLLIQSCTCIIKSNKIYLRTKLVP